MQDINISDKSLAQHMDLISSFSLDNELTLSYPKQLANLYTNYIIEHKKLSSDHGVVDYRFECVLTSPKFAEDRAEKDAKVNLRTIYADSCVLTTEYKKELSKLTQRLGFQSGTLYKDAELMLFVDEVNVRKTSYKPLANYLTLNVLKKMCDQCLTYQIGETRLRKHFAAEKTMYRYSEFLKHPTIIRITEKITEESKRNVYLWRMIAIELKYKILKEIVTKSNK